MNASLLAPGMRVRGRDHHLIGTVQSVDLDDFTVVDAGSGASGQVRFELVQSVDGEVHLITGGCSFYR
jgi:hypothetical protein